MSKRRVVITGIGIITVCGKNKEEYFNNLINTTDTLAELIDFFDTTNHSVKFACFIKDYEPLNYFDKKEVKRFDRFSQFAMIAAREAITEAKIETNIKELPERVGVILGSGIGGLTTFEEGERTLLEKGPARVPPLAIPKIIPNIAAGLISIEFGIKGPSYSTTTACSASAHAIGEAAEVIRRGDADIVITGGSEAVITPLGLAAFANIGALSKRNDDIRHSSCPFDKKRDGFVMGEGAGILILEEEEYAKRRNANIYAELVGYAQTSDAYHITAPEPEGNSQAACMQGAITKAGLNPEDIDYINAHGTSTPLNDVVETKAIKKVFGEYAYKIPISSTKSVIGHTIGAAGAIELITCILSMQNNIILPTVNLTEPDPECDLDYVPNKARKKEINICLSNSFAFGGHNVALIVKKYEYKE